MKNQKQMVIGAATLKNSTSNTGRMIIVEMTDGYMQFETKDLKALIIFNLSKQLSNTQFNPGESPDNELFNAEDNSSYACCLINGEGIASPLFKNVNYIYLFEKSNQFSN